MSTAIRTGVEAARLLARNLWTRPILSSESLGWPGLIARRYADCFPNHVVLPPLEDHILILTTRGATRIDGRMTRRMSGEVGTAGSCFLTPRGVAAEWINSHTVDVLHLYFQPTMLAAVMAGAGEAAPERLELRDLYSHADSLLEQLALGLLGELEQANPTGSLYASALIQAIGAHLLRHYSNLSQHGLAQLDRPGRRLSQAQIRQITDYIHAHLAEPLTLDELAGIVHLSPYHFARLFKQAIGQSAHQYVIRQRVDRAKQLLQDATLRIAEVAVAVGFHDHAHFTHHFSRVVGMPPSAYRRNMRNPFKEPYAPDDA